MNDIRDNLKKTVHFLSQEIGPRSYRQTEALNRAASYILSEFTRYGYQPWEQPYEVRENVYRNIIAGLRGRDDPEKLLVVGAHYDTVAGTPGADDNASGVAGLLELARLLKGRSLGRSVDFAAFTLEEPPFFRSRFMGSRVYARSLRERNADVEGMICLEMIGYFTDVPGSQMFPLPFLRWVYPSHGSFITLVSNLHSRGFMHRMEASFRKGTDLKTEMFTGIPLVPGTDFSDHSSFWKFGYNAVMVTDTAFFRNPQYHGIGDVPETLDYGRMAEVVKGLVSAIEELAGT